MTKPQGYTVRVVPADTVQGKPAWNAKVRRKGWIAGYWATVSSGYGPIAYTTEAYAREGAAVWITDNET